MVSPILFWQGSGIGSACLCRESLADQLPLSLLTQSGGGIPAPGPAMLKLHVRCSAGAGRLLPRRYSLVRPLSPVRLAFPGSTVSVRVGARQLENSLGPCPGSMESNEEAGDLLAMSFLKSPGPQAAHLFFPLSAFSCLLCSLGTGGIGVDAICVGLEVCIFF